MSSHEGHLLVRLSTSARRYGLLQLRCAFPTSALTPLLQPLSNKIFESRIIQHSSCNLPIHWLPAAMTPNYNQPYEYYTYEQLPPGNFIRCLVLHPSHGHAALECHLETVNLDDTPVYEAISYLWGSDQRTERISCNGKFAFITANLYSALHRFCQSSTPRLLWADSLCINQEDDIEKGHQVALMGRVFATATRVLIHITGEDGGSASTVASLTSEMDFQIRQALGEVDSKGQQAPRLTPEEKDRTLLDTRWASVACLLSKPWFTRGWVVQEAALAKKAVITWGTESIDYDALMRSLLWVAFRCREIDVKWHLRKHYIYTDLYLLRHRDVAVAFGWTRASVTNAAPKPLATVLDSARDIDFKDPRDRVFAFLSLDGYGQPNNNAGPEPRLIQPDYRKSVEEVYVEFARQQVLLAIKTLHFAQLYDGETATTAVPLWVPCWDLDTHVRLDPWKQPVLQPSHAYGGTVAPRVEGAALTVVGVVFDQIRYHSHILGPEPTVT